MYVNGQKGRKVQERMEGIDRRIQKTKKILSEALIALILEKGYEQVTVQDIIDKANVGRSTFYCHY
jgi:AcrR family transcriptional regulator